ncbi:MAG: hypothetical protein HY292_22465 [Planctomycetes bacterium]|nr:hypothetical protein [Planctomycetota bacterium]
MAKPSSREPRRWVGMTQAMQLVGAPSRRALDRWVACGKLQTTVRNGVRYFSGPAIDRGLAPVGAAAAVEGLSPEEMHLLARPVRRPETPHRPPSSQDVAESLPRMLEPYITGLHEKIDGLTAQVSSLSEAIEERPRPEEVHAEVIHAERLEPSARSGPSDVANGSGGSRLFETLSRESAAVNDDVDDIASYGDGDYAVREGRIPRLAYVLLALVLAALTATILLWVIFDL